MSDGQTPSGQTWVCAIFDRGGCTASEPCGPRCGPAPGSGTPGDERAADEATADHRWGACGDCEVGQHARCLRSRQTFTVFGDPQAFLCNCPICWPAPRQPGASCDQFDGATCPPDGCEFGCAAEPLLDLDGRPIHPAPSTPDRGAQRPLRASDRSCVVTAPTPSPVPGERPWLCVHTLSESDPCEATNPHRGCIWANAPSAAPSAPGKGTGRPDDGWATRELRELAGLLAAKRWDGVYVDAVLAAADLIDAPAPPVSPPVAGEQDEVASLREQLETQRQMHMAYRPEAVAEIAVQLSEDADWQAIAAWCGGRIQGETLPSGDYTSRMIVDGDVAVEGMWITLDHHGKFRVRTEIQAPESAAPPVGEGRRLDEANRQDAPIWLDAGRASAWADGWNACLAAAADREEGAE